MRNYTIVTNTQKLYPLLEKATWVAIDTETTGLEIYQPGFSLVGISLATSAYEGYYIPTGHSNFGELNYQPHNVPINEVRNLLIWIFQNKKTVMHNRSYDRNVLAVTLNIDHALTQETEDTKLAAHLQDENFPKSLKELAKRWLGIAESAKKFEVVENEVLADWNEMWHVEKVKTIGPSGRAYRKKVYTLKNDWMSTAVQTYLKHAGQSAPISFLFEYINRLFGTFKARGILDYKGAVPKDFRYLPVDLAVYYAADDAMNTYGLWNVLSNGLEIDGLDKLYYEIEKPVDDVMTKAEHFGIKISPDIILASKQTIETRMKEAEAEALAAIDAVLTQEDYENNSLNKQTLLNSSKQLAKILYEKFGFPVVEKTEAGAPSTSRSALQKLLNSAKPARFEKEAKLFLTAKTKYEALKKLYTTYTDSLLEKADRNQRIHPSFNVTGTVSGRMSSTSPNFQNIPRLLKEEIASQPWLQGIDIRSAFVADDGYIFVDADYVSMEMVVCAALSGDPNMTCLLNEGRDLHCHTARYAFGVGFDLSDDEFKKRYKEYRQKAKIVNFSMIYGGTDYTLQKNFGFTPEEAQAAVRGYFEGFPGVKTWMENVYRQLENNGYIVYPEYGYIKRMDVRKPKDMWDKEAMRQYRAALRTCQNALIQGFSAFVVKEAIVKLNKAFKENEMQARVAFQVHDEIGVLAPKREADMVAELMRSIMTKWINGVRLDVDVEFKRSLSKNSEGT